jgi:hypothetical protein
VPVLVRPGRIESFRLRFGAGGSGFGHYGVSAREPAACACSQAW